MTRHSALGRGRITTTLVASILAAGALSACSRTVVSGGGAASASPSPSMAPPAAVTAGSLVTPHPALVHARPVPWANAVVAAGGRSLRLYFTGGADAGCGQLDHVSVATAADGTMTLTVFEGSDPSRAAADGTIVCSSVAVRLAVDVALPLTLTPGAKVIDGATGAPGETTFAS